MTKAELNRMLAIALVGALTAVAADYFIRPIVFKKLG